MSPSRLKSPLKLANGDLEPHVMVGRQYLVKRDNGPSRVALVLEIRNTKHGIREVYISFPGADKRLDTWIKETDIVSEVVSPAESSGTTPGDLLKRKKADLDVTDRYVDPSPSAPSTPEREHAIATRVRNFEDVRFGEYLIKTWYYSPYPLLVEPEHHDKTNGSSQVHGLGLTNGNISASSSKDGKKAASRILNGVDHKPKTMRTASDVFAIGVGKGGEGARGRLWVCDLCFKYMQNRDSWTKHHDACAMLRPPGRKVYQRGSHTLWEIDGAIAPLYCQNLSLFGGLFIDHKSVFYHVEGFMFYVLCDADTSRSDHVMAFFSKEKYSYDNYNLACIITFPPFQNKGFGKLLIEFSYYLTKHPSTRHVTGSPGTPERPLSDLGLKGYTAYWTSLILRFCRNILKSAPPLPDSSNLGRKSASPVKSKHQAGKGEERRSLREKRQSIPVNGMKESSKVVVDGMSLSKTPESISKGQFSVAVTLEQIATACHIRIDDAAFTLAELGFLKHRRPVPQSHSTKRKRTSTNAAAAQDKHKLNGVHENGDSEQSNGIEDGDELGEWKDVEVVISREMVDEAWTKWRVKEKSVLDESYVLL